MFAADTPETWIVPNDVPKIDVSPAFRAVINAAAEVEASVLSDPVKAMVLATLTEPAVTESMVTLASVFSKLKMLLSRAVVNCSHHEHCESHMTPK